MSYEYLTSLGVSKNLVNTLDLAFALPYKADKQQSKKIKIGINVSGLLWDDCVAVSYTHLMALMALYIIITILMENFF